MKKLIAMFLAALTALSLTACAAKSGAQPDASEIPDALTILNTVWASYSEDEKFPAAGGDYSEANMTDGQPGTVAVPHDERQHLHLRCAAPDRCGEAG